MFKTSTRSTLRPAQARTVLELIVSRCVVCLCVRVCVWRVNAFCVCVCACVWCVNALCECVCTMFVSF